MKYELDIVRFEVKDVITASGCSNEMLPPPLGNMVVDCGAVA